LGGARVAAAPNLGGESFGIVVLEAMASGCAVVASAIPAFAAVLGDAGELVKPGDSTGLSQRIVDLLMDPTRTAGLSAAARERSLRYDGEVIVERYLEVYAEAIALHR
jgi:phosphatidylinositol alpha-mannosyltransferase